MTIRLIAELLCKSGQLLGYQTTEQCNFDHKLCPMLSENKLDFPHQYHVNSRHTHEVGYVCNTIVDLCVLNIRLNQQIEEQFREDLTKLSNSFTKKIEKSVQNLAKLMLGLQPEQFALQINKTDRYSAQALKELKSLRSTIEILTSEVKFDPNNPGRKTLRTNLAYLRRTITDGQGLQDSASEGIQSAHQNDDQMSRYKWAVAEAKRRLADYSDAFKLGDNLPDTTSIPRTAEADLHVGLANQYLILQLLDLVEEQRTVINNQVRAQGDLKLEVDRLTIQNEELTKAAEDNSKQWAGLKAYLETLRDEIRKDLKHEVQSIPIVGSSESTQPQPVFGWCKLKQEVKGSFFWVSTRIERQEFRWKG